MHIDTSLWGDCAAVISAISAFFSALVVYGISSKANEISIYLAHQNDREIIEKIYNVYADARRNYCSKLQHSEIRDRFPFWDAYNLSELYGLNDISQQIREEIDIVSQLYELNKKIYNKDGTVKSGWGQKDMDQMHELERQLTSEEGKSDVFRAYFKIKKPNWKSLD